VLAVDDEDAMLEVYGELLGRVGVDVVADADPRVAARRVEQGDRFDLIIRDLRMPGIDGLELLRRIRRVQPDAPVVVVTGYPSAESAAACRRLGVRDYIRKPFVPDELARRIRALLGGRSATTPGPAAPEQGPP
jgi:ATP-dependent Lon protease